MTRPDHPLAPIATDEGTLAIVAMDQRNTLRRMHAAAGLDVPPDADLVQLKADFIDAFRGTASALLLDPTYGTPALRLAGPGPRVGVLVAAEPEKRGSFNGEPRTHRDPALDAAWVRSQGGDAVKFLVQLRVDRPVAPGEPDLAAEVLDVVRAVVQDCREAGVPAIVENLIYALPGEQPATAEQRADRIIAAAQALGGLGPDLLKLEYPGSPAACRRLAEAIDVPWAVLSAGVAFEEFADVLQVSCDEGGAVGFIAGRAIWKDTIGMTEPQRRAFLADEGRRRLDGLRTAIAGRARSLTAA
jgi:tagatose-1,6-bisphosphate aldolase